MQIPQSPMVHGYINVHQFVYPLQSLLNLVEHEAWDGTRLVHIDEDGIKRSIGRLVVLCGLLGDGECFLLTYTFLKNEIHESCIGLRCCEYHKPW